MAGNWQEAKLEDLVVFQRGFDLPQNDRRPGKYPIVASTGIVGCHEEYQVEAPGLIIGRSGSIGGGQYIKERFWPLNTTLWVKDFKGNDPKFAYYYIRTLDFSIFNAGSGVPTLNRNHIHTLPIKLPSKQEQKAISDVLSSVDDRIELNQQMNETLEETARSLFKSWFVDFEPVHAKMEGKNPEGISDDLAALFPSRLIESSIGMIPEGWDIREIGSLVDAVGGATPSTKNPLYWDGGTHCWATPKDLSSIKSHVLLNTERKITDEGLRKISSGLLPPASVLLSSRAPIGYLVVAEVPVSINQGFIGMKPKEKIGTQFILHWTLSNMDAIKSRANGSTFQEISKSSFRPIPVILPPQRITEAFERIAGSLHSRVVQNIRQNNRLGIIRDALLPKLISGELRVSDAEPSIKEAV